MDDFKTGLLTLAENGVSGHVIVCGKPEGDPERTAVGRCDALWRTAEALCADDTEKEHVQKSALSWRYWKACNLRGEFSVRGDPRRRVKENEKLLADYRRFGITRLTEISKLSEKPNLALTPSFWGDGTRIRF